MRKNYERRQHLASMLLPDDPEKGRSVLVVDFVDAAVVVFHLNCHSCIVSISVIIVKCKLSGCVWGGLGWVE